MNRLLHLWVAKGGSAPRLFSISAASHSEAAAAARSQGYTVLQQCAVPEKLDGSRRGLLAKRHASISGPLFAQQLSTLLQAGIGPVEAVKALVKQSRGAGTPVLQQLLSELEQGRSLAQALEATAAFDTLLIALVRASEMTSNLPDALQRYLQHAEQTQAVRQRVITASVYPVLLLAVGTLVMAFLLTYVVPRFSGIFASLHTDLPWTARLLLNWGQLVKDHGTALALSAAGAVATLAAAAASPTVRAKVFAWILTQRHVGHYVQLVYFARLYRTIGTLLDGGIPFPKALEMAAALLPVHLRTAAFKALDKVREGLPPSHALALCGLTSPVADQLLQVGERSGELGAMMNQAAIFHEGETARVIERFMRALEPVVMTVIGVGIGGIVVIMYMPIFELASAIQ
ncbi:type II secretion system F family protein [Eleftheria terrae]|uniref:type II secretion system F family protein n=1 Tax=Eleftheria terrae TaxID=1597781 RepID=UPI00263BCDB2|nr:type II secretion system F family protein [Eleftheria terrae]WKB56139.1 type II secretion system F family protein [Eleftheria terrae]